MMGKTHMLGGLAAGAGLTLAVNLIFPENGIELASAGAFMTSATISALLPDVDEKNSTAGRKLIAIPIALFILKVFLFIIEMISIGSFRKKIKEIRKALNHRGLFHWLITWFVFSLIMIILGVIAYFILHENEAGKISLFVILPTLAGFLPGYLSHLLLDMISGRVQLLAPFSKKWYGAPIFKTGGILEVFIFRPLLIGLIIYAILQFLHF